MCLAISWRRKWSLWNHSSFCFAKEQDTSIVSRCHYRGVNYQSKIAQENLVQRWTSRRLGATKKTIKVVTRLHNELLWERFSRQTDNRPDGTVLLPATFKPNLLSWGLGCDIVSRFSLVRWIFFGGYWWNAAVITPQICASLSTFFLFLVVVIPGSRNGFPPHICSKIRR